MQQFKIFIRDDRNPHRDWDVICDQKTRVADLWGLNSLIKGKQNTHDFVYDANPLLDQGQYVYELNIKTHDIIRLRPKKRLAIIIQDIDAKHSVHFTCISSTTVHELWTHKASTPWIKEKKNTHHFVSRGQRLKNDQRLSDIGMKNNDIIYICQNASPAATTATSHQKQVLQEELQLLLEMIKSVNPPDIDLLRDLFDMRQKCAEKLDSIFE